MHRSQDCLRAFHQMYAGSRWRGPHVWEAPKEVESSTISCAACSSFQGKVAAWIKGPAVPSVVATARARMKRPERERFVMYETSEDPKKKTPK